jgi:hypothetical protein
LLRRPGVPAFVALLLAAALLAPAPAVASRAVADSSRPDPAFELNRPPGPVGSYRPRFVHQTQNNCAFASAAMLIDKWTGGDKRPAQDRLRAASGVSTTEGVGMSQLARAVQKATQLKLLWSPGGGDPMNWDALMGRLSRGGAAVLAGAYSRLPAHYQRWNREYAALGASLSGHAVYIERYQPGRRGGRVWMMDPLAGGSRYEGEWISAHDLRAFAWRNARGLVHAVATPEPPPLAGYEFGVPELIDPDRAMAGGQVSVAIPLTVRAGWSNPDNLALSVVWHPETIEPDPDEVAARYLADVAAAREALLAEAAPARAPDRRDVEDGLELPAEAASPDPAADISAEDLAAWRAAASAGATADASTAVEPLAEELAEAQQVPVEDSQVDGHKTRSLKPTKPVLVPLTPRGNMLVAKVGAPELAGTYRLSMELQRRGGGEFEGRQAPSLADVAVQLRGPLVAEYGALKMPSEVVQGTVATVSLTVGNLGSRDWRGENKLRLVGTWQTAAGSWQAGSTTVALESLDRSKVTLDVVAPTDADAGSLVIQLVTGDGVPLSEYGLRPVVVELEFEPLVGTAENQAAQE